jgi:hypothetical protein
MSRIEAFAKINPRPRIVPNMSVSDGIEAARVVFPTCWFDAEKCKEGIRALRNYRWENAQPVHDEHSHAADAFRYLALSKKVWGLRPEIMPSHEINTSMPTFSDFLATETNGFTSSRL